MKLWSRRRTVAALIAVATAGALGVTVATPLLHGHARPPSTPPATHAVADPAEHAVHTTIADGRLLFVGASYSIGLGATAPSAGYPSLLADRLHRDFAVDAVSGTGFQNPGRAGAGTFAQRIMRTPTSPPPRIVIIQGGRDDTRYPTAKEFTAALDTIRLAQTRFATAQVVVLGPIPASLPVSATIEAIRSQIARACVAARAGFVDPIALQWITAANVHQFSGRIRGHPNDAGYAYIARKLMAALPAALRDSQAPLQQRPVPTVAPSPSTLT